MVCACLACNVKKGGRTPHEAHMKLVANPIRPKRNPLLLLKLNNPKYESWRIWLEQRVLGGWGKGLAISACFRSKLLLKSIR